MKTLGKFIHRLSACLILVAFFKACSDDDGNGIAIRKTFESLEVAANFSLASGEGIVIHSLDELDALYDFLSNKTHIQEMRNVDYSKYSLVCVASFQNHIQIESIERLGDNKIKVRTLRFQIAQQFPCIRIATVMIDEIPEGTSVEVEFYSDF